MRAAAVLVADSMGHSRESRCRFQGLGRLPDVAWPRPPLLRCPARSRAYQRRVVTCRRLLSGKILIYFNQCLMLNCRPDAGRATRLTYEWQMISISLVPKAE